MATSVVEVQLLLVFILLTKCWGERGIEVGGPIRNAQVYRATESRVYHVTTDLIIERSGNLTIDPGVTLRFLPGVGITVKGALIAEGTPENRIVFTSSSNPSYHQPFQSSQSYHVGDGSDNFQSNPQWPSVRLVDGDTILQGRLQIYYRNKWRSVCTNSKNWTVEDLRVTCYHLGYSGGFLYHWFDRSNDSSQLLYENPNCTGDEISVTECKNWGKRQLGGGVCDFHQDIGIQCEPTLHEDMSNHWRGIKFDNAETKMSRADMVNWPVSHSSLAYVDVLFAGRDLASNASSALECIGVPPNMTALQIMWSAYNGANFTLPDVPVLIRDSVIAVNRGYGIYVNTTVGQVEITNTTVEENGADGIRYFFQNPQLVGSNTFCEASNFGQNQRYPYRLTHKLHRVSSYLKDCEQPFTVNRLYGKTLTIHFPVLISDAHNASDAGEISVYDGQTANAQLLARFPVLNDTQPQSVSSTRDSLYVRYKHPFDRDVFFTIELVSDFGKAYDLNVTGSNITNNNGRGIAVENQRSGTVLNHTLVTGSNYVAALHVMNGAGDVIVNNSRIINNVADGINITHVGGYKHFDRSVISNNTGRGIAVWYNETSPKLAFNFTAHLSYSEVVDNGFFGILIGNFCRSESFWNISMNTFRSNGDSAIQMVSCWHENQHQTLLRVTNNKFQISRFLAVHLFPLLNANVVIEHNQFEDHKRGVLFISNRDIEHAHRITTTVEISYNRFTKNLGAYVANIGLLEDSPSQRLMFTQNHLQNNIINEQVRELSPRSRVAAVVAVSSSNAIVHRNYFSNPTSRYELGSHLEAHSAFINASMNYWGIDEKREAHEVYRKIFDRKDRYNLARVEFIQYITSGYDLTTTLKISEVEERDKIMQFRNGSVIGGVVSGQVRLEEGRYQVTRDIFVRSLNSELQIDPGVTLQFEHSTGMMVQGLLKSEGTSFNKITFTVLHGKKIKSATSSNIRLSSRTEGKLEVRVGNVWGSVCLYGWDMQDAAVACHQLGYVLNPRDWLLEKSEFSSTDKPEGVLLSKVECTELDTDLSMCRSETEADFENSCTQEVGIRCYDPTWSGIRLGMAAKESIITNTVIEKAGVVDFATHQFGPALQLDFNRHKIEDITVQDSSDSGLGIMWNDIYHTSINQNIMRSQFSGNKLHGVITRSQGIDITETSFSNNLGSGIHYDPMFTWREQKDLISWISRKDKSNFISVPSDIQGRSSIHVPEDSPKYFVFEKTPGNSIQFQIQADFGRDIGIMVLSPFSKETTEEVTIYGRLDRGFDVPEWNIKKNFTAFPLRNQGSGITVVYNPGRNPDGSAVLYISALPGSRNKPIEETFPTIHINNCVIKECLQGFSSNHYNREIGQEREHYHRYSNETIIISDCQISENKKEAIYVWTPYWEPEMLGLAEANYTLLRNRFFKNGGGITQFSRDIRNSNNLFHWTLNDTKMENNTNGGVRILLPYVWQYSENYTHSCICHNSTFENNANFEFVIDGHFARVNMSGNSFRRNHCKTGLLTMAGMEKEFLIEENTFEHNVGEFVVEFHIKSHTETFGLVSASFRQNILKSNNDNGRKARSEPHQPLSYALGIRGVQNVNMTRNIFVNPNMQFELLAGIITSVLDTSINVAENWWGTLDIHEIQEKIFDFDDWNSYTIADFNPVLGRESVLAGLVPITITTQQIDLSKPLGGRIYKSLTLPYSSKPYTVTSDLTVMPGATLRIEDGNVVEFHPSVGILVLGDLLAKGTYRKPITMRPVRRPPSIYRFRREVPKQLSVRLCIDELCESPRNDGYLEIFNATTVQWVPVCDTRFSETNAEVVCNQLGYNSVNVQVKRGPRLDVNANNLGRIRAWPHPLECSGEENNLSECPYRLNGYSDTFYSCNYMGDFVYVYCGDDNRNGTDHHWGGIRFSVRDFELHSQDVYFPTHSGGYYLPPQSSLQYVELEGAGMLHGKASAAIQMVQREVAIDDVKVIKSAGNGIEVLAPPRNIFFNNLLVEDNLGIGISILSLNGGSSDNSGYSYPLKEVEIPYNIFGMADMCDANKQLTVSGRILVYYKYDNQPADCVKIFTSPYQSIGFRLLQLNLFNATGVSAKPDMIRLYDGDIFNQSTPILGEVEIGNETDPDRFAVSFFRSSDSTLSLQMHVSGGSGVYGFIAEVTIPHGYSTNGDLQHNITNSLIRKNERGAIQYKSANENTPAITIAKNRIDYNGKALFGNYTTTQSAVLVDVQNAKHLTFYSNLLYRNQGGLHLYADSQSNPGSLNCLLINNLFTENENRETLLVMGLYRSGHYQKARIEKNYFTRNHVPYLDTVVLIQVVSDFKNNLLVNNTGIHIMDIYGFERAPVSQQLCIDNWFTNNRATMLKEKSTIFASNAGQRFFRNYFVNPDNDFEITAANRTEFELKKMMPAPINATYNWWGFNETIAVSGRIKDENDYPELIEVQYIPYFYDNRSVLSGNCAGGWQKIGDTCFLYVSGFMTFDEAKHFCEMDNSSMPYAKQYLLHDLMHFIEDQQYQFERHHQRVWVESIDVGRGECAILHDGRLKTHYCGDILPFLCEKDPDTMINALYWYKEPLAIAAISVTSITLLLIGICLGCWLCKSRFKYQEKLERRNSIRASNRSLASSGFGELGYKRRMERELKKEVPKVMEFKMNGSFESIEKMPSRFSSSMDESYDAVETRNSAMDYPDYGSQLTQESRMDTVTVDTMMVVHPAFDLTYENKGYMDRSSSHAMTPAPSKEWSTTTGSTLDMKRQLDVSRDAESKGEEPYHPSPSPRSSSFESYYSGNGDARAQPLETAM